MAAEKNAKRRLTYHTFLEKYKKVLKLGGQIHFKTDNAKLFEWSLPEMESCYLELRNVTRDLHANGPVGIMTGYEEKILRAWDAHQSRGGRGRDEDTAPG